MPVEVVTFGCRLNAVESEAMRRAAQAAELEAVEPEGAGLNDTILINTCAVTAEATRQARQAIRRLGRERPDARIVVTGCAAQTEPQTFADMPEVARVVGNAGKLDPAAWLAGDAKVAVSDIMAVTQTTAHRIDGVDGRPRAFVQVQNGCDHRCTFCIIPYGRGNSRSVPMGEVVTQVRRVIEHGAREVVLTGVDVTSYGADLPGVPPLGRLVRQILKHVPGLERLRISSIDSVEVDAELLDAFANDPRLMPHLHLSLQAGDDMILKRMKRRHLRADAIAFCEQMRRLRPDVVFGADIIAGFPTESEDMFTRSLDLVDQCGLTHLHVFPFSPRHGTPAARMPQLRHEVVKQRARRLRERGQMALRRHLDGEVGQVRRVLVESAGLGRTDYFTPMRIPADFAQGAVVDFAVTGHDGRQLLAA